MYIFIKHSFAISRPDMPEVCYQISLPSDQRAQGIPGARCTRGLVRKSAQKTHTSIQVQRRQSGIPCAMVLRLIARSPTAASTATRPNVRDDGQRPSFGTGWQIIARFAISEKQKYFYRGDWTGQIRLIRHDKSDFSRNSCFETKFRFRGIADMAALAAGSTQSRMTQRCPL